MRVAESQDLYVTQFETLARELERREPSWLTDVRNSAFTRFRLLGFPTARDEEWRFTPVAPIVNATFTSARRGPATVDAAEIAPFLPPARTSPTLVFVNGRFDEALSSIGDLPAGVVVASLAAVLDGRPELVARHYTRGATFEKQAFTALNTALSEDGAAIILPPRVALSEPIHLLYFGTEGIASHPRTLIVAAESSAATIVEGYAGRAGEQYLTNAVTEIACGENSQVEHYRVQRDSDRAFHVSTTHVRLERSAVFVQQNFAFGGAIARNDIGARLDGEGIECTLNGLYLGNSERLTDNHTTIDHATPHCSSHQIYKGMLDGRARGVFNGKIFVRQDAQKTDAKQTNQVLLLSDDATINTKPQLEIFADDVKCTHGATVGRIDAESLFYLRARGIGEDEARAMLVHAFARDIIDRVKLPELCEALEQTLLGYLAGRI